jgi:hypothetical protein
MLELGMVMFASECIHTISDLENTKTSSLIACPFHRHRSRPKFQDIHSLLSPCLCLSFAARARLQFFYQKLST